VTPAKMAELQFPVGAMRAHDLNVPQRVGRGGERVPHSKMAGLQFPVATVAAFATLLYTLNPAETLTPTP